MFRLLGRDKEVRDEQEVEHSILGWCNWLTYWSSYVIQIHRTLTFEYWVVILNKGGTHTPEISADDSGFACVWDFG